jgi:hypothetical protein
LSTAVVSVSPPPWGFVAVPAEITTAEIGDLATLVDRDRVRVVQRSVAVTNAFDGVLKAKITITRSITVP